MGHWVGVEAGLGFRTWRRFMRSPFNSPVADLDQLALVTGQLGATGTSIVHMRKPAWLSGGCLPAPSTTALRTGIGTEMTKWSTGWAVGAE
jgi:hypothetical protein